MDSCVFMNVLGYEKYYVSKGVYVLGVLKLKKKKKKTESKSTELKKRCVQ